MPELDAVIAWVDGLDENHRRKRLEYMRREGRAGSDNATLETRFIQQDEVYYCIASILKYAPFIRRIHLITDDQRPRYINGFAATGNVQPDRIRVVDHRQIFAGHEQVMPTFNSLSIGTMLWRVPDLAEHFVYFNDDVFLNAPAKLTQFVLPDGQLQLHGRTRSVGPRLWQWRWRRWRSILLRRPHPEPSFQLAQMLAAHRLGQHQYLHLSHLPHVLRRSTLEKYFGQNPDVLYQQIGYRFRDLDQFSTIALSNQLEIANGSASIERSDCCAYIEPNQPTETLYRAIAAVQEASVPYACIQSLDAFPEVQQREFHAALTQKFLDFLPPDFLISHEPQPPLESAARA